MKVRNPAEGGQKWEYRVVAGDAENSSLLDEHGAEGWELAGVIREAGTRAIFYFKRRQISSTRQTA